MARALLLGLCLIALTGPVQGQELRYFRIGTGAPETSYFPIGGVIASAVSNPPGSRDCDQGGSCGVPGLIALAQTTSGSIDNLTQIAAGRTPPMYTGCPPAPFAATVNPTLSAPAVAR